MIWINDDSWDRPPRRRGGTLLAITLASVILAVVYVAQSHMGRGRAVPSPVPGQTAKPRPSGAAPFSEPTLGARVDPTGSLEHTCAGSGRRFQPNCQLGVRPTAVSYRSVQIPAPARRGSYLLNQIGPNFADLGRNFGISWPHDSPYLRKGEQQITGLPSKMIFDINNISKLIWENSGGWRMSEERVTERKGVEPGQIVMPFYLICDVSGSMTGDMPALNEGVRKLHRSISASPVVDDVAQLSLLTFSDSARVVMPMGQLSGLTIPQLRADGGTNYGAAFRELALVIVQDNAKLKGQGYKVYRPCAFFLTDGEPLDSDWHRTFSQTLTYDPKALTGMKDHPIFVPFGFRDAPDSVLRQLAYPPEKGKWYHTRSMAIDQVLSNILDVIMNTVVTSANSVGAGRPAVVQQPPAPGSALTQGDSEYDPDFV